jgi:PTH1 family peptidyl-tRNA hydrolase
MFRKKPPPPALPAEWLVVGLGNPGPEYAATRHNVGFELIDRLAKKHRIDLKTRRHRGVYGAGEIEGVGAALLKPLTFMNLSGQSVNPVMREFGLRPERVLVIADELDFPLGKAKIKPSGGPAGHNGHRSIIQALGTDAYPRLRIGIGKGGDATVSHVLSRFTPDERDVLDDVLKACEEAVERVVRDGLERGMEWLNARP